LTAAEGIYRQIFLDAKPIIINNPAFDEDSTEECHVQPSLKTFLGIPLKHSGQNHRHD
jgi:hypothetical protein